MNILGVEQTQDVVEVALERELASESIFCDIQSKIIAFQRLPVFGPAVLFASGRCDVQAPLPELDAQSNVDGRLLLSPPLVTAHHMWNAFE